MTAMKRRGRRRAEKSREQCETRNAFHATTTISSAIDMSLF
jgi:hypothetical protein